MKVLVETDSVGRGVLRYRVTAVDLGYDRSRVIDGIYMVNSEASTVALVVRVRNVKKIEYVEERDDRNLPTTMLVLHLDDGAIKMINPAKFIDLISLNASQLERKKKEIVGMVLNFVEDIEKHQR